MHWWWWKASWRSWRVLLQFSCSNVLICQCFDFWQLQKNKEDASAGRFRLELAQCTAVTITISQWPWPWFHHWPSLYNAAILTTSTVIMVVNQWVILDVTWNFRNTDLALNFWSSTTVSTVSDCPANVESLFPELSDPSSEFMYHCHLTAFCLNPKKLRSSFLKLTYVCLWLWPADASQGTLLYSAEHYLVCVVLGA